MMRSGSPAVGAGSTSNSQHVESKQSSIRRRQQQVRPFSGGSGGCRPTPSMPPGRMAGSAGGGRPRPASTAVLQQSTLREVPYLYQQLSDALQQQSHLEEQRQKQIVQYRRQLRMLCDDNATLRNIIQAGERRRRDAEVAAAAGLVALTGTRTQTSGMGNGPATVTEAEVEVLLQRTNLARRRRNKVLHEINVNEAALDIEAKAQESLAEQAQMRLDPATLLTGANRSVYLRMMRLEQLIDKILCKQRIASVILANYRHHLATLSTEATQYNAQQTLLEREYADRHRDHLKLLQLHDTARAAYATAVEALHVVQKNASRMRKAKEKALQETRREVDKGIALTQQQERRAVDLQQQLEEEAQMLDAEENTKEQLERQRMNPRTALSLLRASCVSREGGTELPERNSNRGGAGQSSPGTDERVAAYEVTFRDMMRVAKVDTLDALIKVYQAEIDQQYRLQDELNCMREAQAALQQEVHQLRERAKQTKYTVGAATGLAAKGTASPLMERELQLFVQEENESLITHVGANRGHQALLMEVVERVNRLAELVANYRTDVPVPSIQRTPALAKRSSTLPLHVAVLAQKLLALAADTAGATDIGPSSTASASVKDAGHGGGVVNRYDGSSSGIAVVSSTHLVIPANNRRVSLAHEGVGGGAGGRGPGGRRGRTAADVAGISSTAARALLYPYGRAPGGSEDGAPRTLANQRRRRSSAAAGAGFIEGQEDKDDVSLATVAALPPPGGRVLDFDGTSTDTSELHSSSINDSDADGRWCSAGGDGGSPNRAAAAARSRRRSSKQPRHINMAGVHHANLQTRVRAVEDDHEDPLRREEVKHMSELIRARKKLEAKKDARRP